MKRVFCLVLAAFLSLSLASCGVKDNTDIAVYERFAAENGVMPELDALGEYDSIFSLYHSYEDIFGWKSCTLIAEYDAEHFDEAVQSAEAGYAYQTTPLTDKVDENTLSPEFSCDGYDFRVLAMNIYCTTDDEFPEKFYCVGVNREKNRIA